MRLRLLPARFTRIDTPTCSRRKRWNRCRQILKPQCAIEKTWTHAHPFCSDHFWPDKRLRTRLSPQSMRLPIRWEVTSTFRTASATCWCCHAYCGSTTKRQTLVRDTCPDHHAADEFEHASDDVVSEPLADYFEALVDRLTMPPKLRELNVPRDSLPMLARDAMKQERLLVNNPRQLNEQDALRIYEAAY